MAKAQEHLTLQYVDHPYGRCQVILQDMDGNVLVDRIYKNKNSAQASVRQRLKKEGLEGASLTRVDPDDEATDEADDGPPSPEPEQASTAAPATPADKWLHKLRQEAQRVLDEALKLRERADLLEVEHKRLTAAADVLEGPE